MRLPNWFVKLSKTKRVLVVLLLAMALYVVYKQLSIRFPSRDHKMNEFTQHMQTLCVGRFLIDLPAQATIKQWNQKVNDVEIARSEKTAPNFTMFEQNARDYERALRAKPHPKKQSMFRETLRFTPDSFTFVYLEDEHTSDLYIVETWLWRDRKQFRLMGRLDIDYYSDFISENRATVTSLQLRDNATIPKEPGACGDGTFFSGKDFRLEDFGISVRLPGYPGMWLGFGTETHVRSYEEKGLIERFTRSFGMPDVAGVKMTNLRSANISINTQSGEEYVVKGSNSDETYPGLHLNAELEIYPVPNAIDKPMLKLMGGSDSHDNGTNKPHPRVMDDDLFMSIWDKTIKSIRQRPGAL